MKNIIFMAVSSFLPLTLLNLFADNNSAMAQPQQGQPQMGQPQGGQPQMGQGGQPQMGQAQRGTAASQGLEAYSLPAGTITENDMPQIKTVIQQVLDKVSESRKSTGKKADYQTLKSGILSFQDWMKQQGCVDKVSTTYNIESTDKWGESIFYTFPGQLPFDIVFNMGGDVKKPYRLLIFVSKADLFKFGSLVENKSINGVPAIKSWPKDVQSYWENKL